MATKKRNTKNSSHNGRIAAIVYIILILCLALTVGFAAANANLVHVRRAEVRLADLPPSFDGTTILFASDIDLCGLNTPSKTAALFGKLQNLNPDVLILGGDFTSHPLLDVLNGGNSSSEGMISERSTLFSMLGLFNAPLGKYVVAAPEDLELPGFPEMVSQNGFIGLIDGSYTLTQGNASLVIRGFSSENALQNRGAASYSRNECVIAVPYSPSLIPKIMTVEARDNGHWVDLILTGHTHGGQIRFGKQAVLPLTALERAYMAGWTTESGIPVLTTSGIGCEAANLRLGSSSEVWLITLKCP